MKNIAPLPNNEGISSVLLEGFSAEERTAILNTANRMHFRRNSVVFNQAHPAEHLYLLIQGRARFFFVTRDGRKILLRWLVSGQIFGLSAMLQKPTNYLVSAEIVEDSVVLVWQRKAIRRLVEEYPRLLDNVLSLSEDYLTWYMTAHDALTGQTARERLAHLLATLAETIGRRVPGGIEIDVTNEELASAAAVTPFTTSRLVSGWQRTGAILKNRGRILIRSMAKGDGLRRAEKTDVAQIRG